MDTLNEYEKNIDNELPDRITHMPDKTGYNDITMVKLRRYIKHAKENQSLHD